MSNNANLIETAMSSCSSNNNKQSKDPRASNFSAVKDVLCTLAFFRASEDPICEAKQKVHIFKQKIEAAYNLLKDAKYKEEKRDAQRPNYLQANGGIGFEPRPYPSRTGLSLYTRFNRYISPATIKFMSIVKQNKQPKSGKDIGAWHHRLLFLYNEKFGSNFKFMQCYNAAKDKPKFMSLLGVQDLTATNSIAASTNSTSSGSEDSDACTPQKRPATSIGNKAMRPVGTKKAKKMKQEDEMADQMAKRFGVKTTIDANNNNNGASDFTSKSSTNRLHDALGKFLAMASKSMSTWMMQSMSASASKDIRHAYADECIRKKILLMKARNLQLEQATKTAKTESSNEPTCNEDNVHNGNIKDDDNKDIYGPRPSAGEETTTSL